MNADAHTQAVLVKILRRFCSAIAAKDAEGAMQLFAPDGDVILVTSGESLLRGPDEIKAFLQAYVQGPSTYSWAWSRQDISEAGEVTWLLAEGIETASSQGGEKKHTYRMSMVLKKRGKRWLLMQVHGSSPQPG